MPRRKGEHSPPRALWRAVNAVSALRRRLHSAENAAPHRDIPHCHGRDLARQAIRPPRDRRTSAAFMRLAWEGSEVCSVTHRSAVPASPAFESTARGAQLRDWKAERAATAIPRARTRSSSVRATSAERSQPLPGDNLIAEPLASLTHAITIDRPARDVWPWLTQMGAGSRAGWYSYDMLDNGRQRSQERIVPELQHLTPGMIFPALPGVTNCFTLVAFEPERYLILGWRPNDTLVMTWAFVLTEVTSGSCRLVVRARRGAGYHFHTLPRWLTSRIGPTVHFIMQRKQLLGIKRRVESRPADTPASTDRLLPADQDAA